MNHTKSPPLVGKTDSLQKRQIGPVSNLSVMIDQNDEASILPNTTDEDATPKPLRIVKQNCSTPEAHIDKSETESHHLYPDSKQTGGILSGPDKEPDSSLCKSNQCIVPIRTSSISQSNEGNAIKPQRRLVASKAGIKCVSPSPSNARTLRIRKSRKSDIRNSDSDTRILLSEGYSCTNPLQNQTTRNPSDYCCFPQPTTVCSISSVIHSRVRPSLGRVSTSADFANPPVREPVDNDRWSSMVLGPIPLVRYDHRRIQSADSCNSFASPSNRPHESQIAVNPLADEFHPKESSYKQRLFNKFTNRFPSRTTMSQAAIERNGYCKDSHQRLYSVKENRIFGIRTGSRATTKSSAETVSSFSSGLDGTIAAFPNPPKSVVTSATLSNSTNLGPRAAIPAILSSVNGASIIGASLTLIPEVDTIAINRGETLFVAVDVEGVINTPSLAVGSGLDVVVVIDNS